MVPASYKHSPHLYYVLTTSQIPDRTPKMTQVTFWGDECMSFLFSNIAGHRPWPLKTEVTEQDLKLTPKNSGWLPHPKKQTTTKKYPKPKTNQPNKKNSNPNLSALESED